MSLPSRERGLKLPVWAAEKNLRQVAPFAGAWIEIRSRYRTGRLSGSLPSRERGLKFLKFSHKAEIVRSLPSRERGLKWKLASGFDSDWGSLPSRERGLKLGKSGADIIPFKVAPFAGAWIEI